MELTAPKRQDRLMRLLPYGSSGGLVVSNKSFNLNFSFLKRMSLLLLSTKVKVKISPLQAMKAHGDVNASVNIYTDMALGRGRLASPTLGRLYRR